MTLVVEDGTNVAGADSYVTIAFVDAYAAARGVSDWAKLAGGAKEIAIRVAQEYMFVQFSSRWKGARSNDTQALDWPRSDVLDRAYEEIANNAIPLDVQKAQAQYAIEQALNGGLFFTPPISDTGGEIEEIEQKADVVMQRIKYARGTRATRKKFPLADGLIRWYITGATGLAVRL